MSSRLPLTLLATLLSYLTTRERAVVCTRVRKAWRRAVQSRWAWHELVIAKPLDMKDVLNLRKCYADIRPVVVRVDKVLATALTVLPPDTLSNVRHLVARERLSAYNARVLLELMPHVKMAEFRLDEAHLKELFGAKSKVSLDELGLTVDAASPYHPSLATWRDVAHRARSVYLSTITLTSDMIKGLGHSLRTLATPTLSSRQGEELKAFCPNLAKIKLREIMLDSISLDTIRTHSLPLQTLSLFVFQTAVVTRKTTTPVTLPASVCQVRLERKTTGDTKIHPGVLKQLERMRRASDRHAVTLVLVNYFIDDDHALSTLRDRLSGFAVRFERCTFGTKAAQVYK